MKKIVFLDSNAVIHLHGIDSKAAFYAIGAAAPAPHYANLIEHYSALDRYLEKFANQFDLITVVVSDVVKAEALGVLLATGFAMRFFPGPREYPFPTWSHKLGSKRRDRRSSTRSTASA